MNFLNGYKTYLAAGLLILTGLTQIVTAMTGGEGDFISGWNEVIAGLAVFGVGHKLEKINTEK